MTSDERFQRKLRKMKKRGERYKKEKEIRDAYADYLPDRKKRKVSNIMLVVIVFSIVSYTVASFWLQYKTGTSIDPTLTTLFYAFWGTEIVGLVALKVTKTKHGRDE